MYYIKELCVKFVTYQKSYRDARSAKYIEKGKKTLFTSKFEFNLKKKLVKCYVWSPSFYGAETWTLRKVDQK
jgi:hypothetical protein